MERLNFIKKKVNGTNMKVDSFKIEFYDKPTKPKKGKLTQPNGNIFEGTFYDRNKNNFKTGTYTIKNEGKVKYVNGKIVSRSGFKKKLDLVSILEFLTPILALVSFCRSVNSFYAIVEICESIYKNSTNYWSDYSLPCRHQYIIRANRFRLGQF